MSVLDTKKIIMRVSVVTMIANFSLMALKLLAGIFGHSSALISDAVNSASDVICTVIVIIGVTISSKPIDDDHPYGHERLECVVSILLSVLLFGTGLAIGYTGVEKLIDGSYMQTEKPNALAIAAVAVTIAVKETLYWYTIKKAKSIDSVSLKASAWDHRVDVFSSLGRPRRNHRRGCAAIPFSTSSPPSSSVCSLRAPPSISSARRSKNG